MKNGLDVKFEVTKDDIKYGLPGDSNMCAISRCAKRDGWESVETNGDTIAVSAYGVRWEASLPKKASKFVKKFDDQLFNEDTGKTTYPKKVKPISFSVRLRPVEVL